MASCWVGYSLVCSEVGHRACHGILSRVGFWQLLSDQTTGCQADMEVR